MKPKKIQPFKPHRRKPHANNRVVNHLCPTCLSSLSRDLHGNVICTGDRLKLSEEKMNCDFNDRYAYSIPDERITIPDPIVVKKLERLLQRQLTEEELEEGYRLVIDDGYITIPRVVFPDDV